MKSLTESERERLVGAVDGGLGSGDGGLNAVEIVKGDMSSPGDKAFVKVEIADADAIKDDLEDLD